ncbi:globin domain-containing protein [Botrimarina hoheduenensis]|uniref:Flavohemoprotein n=1 Tax=Botrimarina hoheduenensis TaxID=2528000 RepID=A0A5C5WF52_9BACT|nr:globin domain-containing protein [Botrimarina hoheduenensis]TWT48693.1 Flavohemoprotein [Botrimarina hoheduenensis]
MTPHQIKLVQTSWKQLEPIADTAVRLFYRRVFEIAPVMRSLFKTSVSEQGDKLVQTLDAAVSGLNHPETFAPIVEAFSSHQDLYGVEADRYELVSEALLWTFQQCLGTAFTVETEAAWAEAYDSLAGEMISDGALPCGRRELVG